MRSFLLEFNAKALFCSIRIEDRDKVEERALKIEILRDELMHKTDWESSHLQKTLDIYTDFKQDSGQHIEHIPMLKTLQRDRNEFFQQLYEIPKSFHENGR
jgi:hypothetical protein